MEEEQTEGTGDEAAEACIRDIAIVHTLTEAITTRWREAQLEPSPGDDVKAGLAALEFLDALRDCEGPWNLGEGASIIDIDRRSAKSATQDSASENPRSANAASW